MGILRRMISAALSLAIYLAMIFGITLTLGRLLVLTGIVGSGTPPCTRPLATLEALFGCFIPVFTQGAVLGAKWGAIIGALWGLAAGIRQTSKRQ
jgi:uncharacterized membrane protein